MSYELIVFPDASNATGELRHDSGFITQGHPATHPTGRLGMGFTIPDDGSVPNGHGFNLVLSAQGRVRTQRGTLWLNDGHTDFPWTPGQTAACPMDEFPVGSASGSLPLGAATLQGRHGFLLSNGTRYPLVGATGFNLIWLLANGRRADAERYLAALGPNRTVRLFTMATHLFDLPPEVGRQHLLSTLDLLQDYGHYASVVCCVDTASRTFDIDQHCTEVGMLADGHPAAIFAEIGNELYALHETQDNALGDLQYLKDLRAQMPSTLPVSLGSTHGGNDESEIFEDGDLLTIHGDRSNGDQIPGGDEKGWRWVRHSNEQRAYGDRVRKYPINDEPRRDDLATDKHLALAILCRMSSMGDTFHYGGGLRCLPPAGAELLAYDARQRGWALIPNDWTGQYMNAGAVGSPVKSFTNAVRVYSNINAGQGYSLVLGASAGLGIDWSDQWPTRDLVISEGACQLWRVTQ